MILYQKKGLILIALEIKIGDEIKVFVNPYEYIFEDKDHFGYVIHHKNPDFNEINKIDLSKNNAENVLLKNYLTKKEHAINKKEHGEMQERLATLLIEDSQKIKNINFENFFSTKKPIALSQARVKKRLDKNIEGHIIVCGLVKGIKNLILPLRSKTLGN